MVVTITDPDTKEEWTYMVTPRLQKFLDEKVKNSLEQKDKDYVLLIDGYEGSGKSTFAQQIGRYVDPSLKLSRICMEPDEFKREVLNAKPNQCVIYDEAVTGFTGGDSIRRVGKMLKSLMMQMRQKNLFVIIILPVVFEFNKYAVLSRAKALFHIYESGGRRGYFVGYNQKDLRTLYLKGKRTYTYTIRSFFNGRFGGKYTVDEEAYREKKAKSLENMDLEGEDEARNLIRNQILYVLREEYGLTNVQIAELFERYKIRLKVSAIGYSIAKISPRMPRKDE